MNHIYLGLVSIAFLALPTLAREWRHEGLLLDNRDISTIQNRLEIEPWKSAWLDLQQRTKKYSPVDNADESLLAFSVKYAIDNKPEDADSLITALNETARLCSQSYRDGQFLDAAKRLFLCACAFERVRDYERWPNEERRNAYNWLLYLLNNLEEVKKNNLPTKAWLSAAQLAVAVTQEDDLLYKRGEKTFLTILQKNTQDDGSPTESLTRSLHVEFVTGLLNAAEVANHHTDLFFGKDLYHKSYGPKNLFHVCQYFVNTLHRDDVVGVQSWGWLVLATKTFGEPEWVDMVEKLYPVFDPFCCGPVTLTHARRLPIDPPDFGTAPDGFHWLYNFNDTTGWQMSGYWYDLNPNDFYVADRIIRTHGGRDHWLMTDRMYDRFVLRLEYRIPPKSNSGILIWSPVPGRPSMTGYEIQLLDDAGKPPAIDGSGALYNTAIPLSNAQKSAGEWNDIEITCNYPILKVVLNGTTVQDLNLDQHPDLAGRRRRGYIGLQDHNSKVEFRDVRIQILDRPEQP